MLVVAHKGKIVARENQTENICCELLNRQLNIINKNTPGEQVDNNSLGRRNITNRNPLVAGEQTVEVNGNESGSSGESACSCENCTSTCNCADCTHNDNMEFNDEPDSDNEYTDESEDLDDNEWRDVEDEEDCSDDEIDDASFRSNSTHDSHNSNELDAIELMDAFTDCSDEDEARVTIALDVDLTSSSNSSMEDIVASSDGHDEDESHDDEDEEEDDEEEYQEDDHHSEFEVNLEDSDSDFVDNASRVSTESDESYRSRSPVYRLPRQDRQHSENQPARENNQNQADAANPSSASTVKNEPNLQSTSSTTEQDDGTCCICLDDVSTHVVVPCGHICLCQNCTNLLTANDNQRRRKKCPLCKTPFTMVIKVYK